MKTRFALLTAIAVAVSITACSDAIVAPDGANFELVDVDKRIDADDVNAHVYGSFTLEFSVASGGGTGVIMSGPANFPGNPKNAGTCENGLWITKQGHRTSGSESKPHPHCVGEVSGETTVYVVLEPISAYFDGAEGTGGQKSLELTNPREDGRAFLTGSGTHSRGEGLVEAYAIDASTLGGLNKRVGTLTFDMAQYHHNNVDHFQTGCEIDDTYNAPNCLEPTIYATYKPLQSPDGVGVETPDVPGFLYWTSASTPFNYGE